jgi:hypothetical protein
MNPEQSKQVLKAMSRTDAVKMVLADMREEITEELNAAEEELIRREDLFMAQAKNRAMVRHAEVVAFACRSTSVDPENVFVTTTYDFNLEPDTVRCVLTDGSAYDHKIRLVVDVERPDLEPVRDARQEVLRLREMQDPDADEARANVLRNAMEHTEEGQRVLSALKDLRAACKI